MKEGYYNPPDDWKYAAIKDRYKALRADDVDQPGIDFHKYGGMAEIYTVKYLLREISERIKLGDSAAIAIAVSFVIAPVYFHYSGYIRATMARRLRSIELDSAQKQAIMTGYQALLASGKVSFEFKEIKRLYLRVSGSEK